MLLTRICPHLLVKSESRGTLSSVDMGRATWPFRARRGCSPDSHSASLRFGVMPSKAPAITSERTATGFSLVRLTRSSALT